MVRRRVPAKREKLGASFERRPVCSRNDLSQAERPIKVFHKVEPVNPSKTTDRQWAKTAASVSSDLLRDHLESFHTSPNVEDGHQRPRKQGSDNRQVE